MKVLLAEDDVRLGSFLQTLFSARNVVLDLIKNGTDIEYYAENEQYDVLILDWMLPGKSGTDACSDLRKKGYQGGIIILTARTTLNDKITGLNCGADDYLPKPFEFEELYARINAVARRSQHFFKNDIFKIESCIFDCTKKNITYFNNEIKMTPREFQIVELLARNSGQIITREILLEKVWGLEKDVTTNSLDAYMKLIRKKLEQIENKFFIHNIRSVGYLWKETDV